jgi:hypothetical protein
MCSAVVNRANGKCLGPNEFSFAVFYAIPRTSCCFCPVSWVGLEFLELAKKGYFEWERQMRAPVLPFGSLFGPKQFEMKPWLT